MFETRSPDSLVHMWCTLSASGKVAMATSASAQPRLRIGNFSIFSHHGKLWLYYRKDNEPIRLSISADPNEAEAIASLLNAKQAADRSGLDLSRLMSQWLPSEVPEVPVVTVNNLQKKFLDHHETILHSMRGTVERYRTATDHLIRFAGEDADPVTVDVAKFLGHLRQLKVSPNGHANTAKRPLRDKGIRYILETCRAMLRYGIRYGVLPETTKNPFSLYPLERLKIRDAKPIFVFTAEQEVSFFNAVTRHMFAIHMLLSKTGLRPSELTHLLIEDLDLESGWLRVSSKPELGWLTKTNRERSVPLLPEMVDLLRSVIGKRTSGLVFCRRADALLNESDRGALFAIAQCRLMTAQIEAKIDRRAEERVLGGVWRDAGVVDPDRIRLAFITAAQAAGLPPHATCTKSWRHTFATLMQQAKVDPLIRQETLGHKPTDPSAGALGMTGVYTHTDPSTQRDQVFTALRLRSLTIDLIAPFIALARKAVWS